MMKRLSVLFFLIAVFVQFLPAQEKILTAADAAWLNRDLIPENLSQLGWIPQSNRYGFVKDKAFLAFSPSKEQADTLLKLDQLNTALHAADLDSLRRFPFLNWMDEQSLWMMNGGALLTFDLKTNQLNKICQLPKEAENIDINPSSRKVAFTIDNNLYVADGNKTWQITNEPAGVQCGKTVHRNEFGITKGTFWSPDGKKLAFYRMDERMVANYPLVDLTEPIATLRNEPYPMAGQTSHQVVLKVFRFADSSTTVMQTGLPADQYLTAVTWHPASEKIFIGLLNREQNHLRFNAYNTNDGQLLQTLFEEADDEYVEPQFPAYFVPGNDNQFIWLSERNGFRHCYLYQTDGKLLNQLTQGDWMVTDFEGFDTKGHNFFFTSTEVSPLERHFYVQDLKSGKRKQLTSEPGTHNVSFSQDGNYFIDQYTSTTVPRKINLLNAKGKTLQTLLEAADPLANYDLGKTEMHSLTAQDGSTLYARMIKPAHFDSTKKYPVVVYVYGGPHAQLVTNSWLGGANLYLNMLAQKGYLVFTLDNRGSANRGAAFEQIVHRRLGQHEMEDQLRGIDFLKSLPYVDADRIGVDGWSFGGFMSINLKLNHPEVFKVAVAGGPVTNWKYYEVMYGERYMDTPEENPEGYATANLVEKMNQLEGKLLVIHCTTDPVVVWQNSLELVQSAIQAGKQLDYFVYPGHEHNVRGRDREHLIKKITEYFDEHL